MSSIGTGFGGQLRRLDKTEGSGEPQRVSYERKGMARFAFGKDILGDLGG